MNNLDQTRFNQLYENHTNALILQGKSEKTIEMYSRSIRRLSQFFDRCPDHLTTDQLKQYFLALVKSHSWSTVKVDRKAIFWSLIVWGYVGLKTLNSFQKRGK